MNYYKAFIKPLLFQMHPDYVHIAVGEAGYLIGKNSIGRELLKRIFYYENLSLETKVFGIHFKNPVGIGAGFDKECKLLNTLPFVGFGFVEVGSITALPYKGNKRPWNMRLKRDEALIVNYGLKNEGVEILSKRIRFKKRETPLFISIAKTNNSNIKGDASIEDYNTSFMKLQELADVVDINVSCPNTGDGLLFCESPELLDRLLKRIGKNKINKPVVLKLKPDLSDKLLEEVLEIATSFSFIKGFIISNLTNNRGLLSKTELERTKNMPGGISGKPLKNLSTEMIKKVYRKTKGKYIIVGLGGIFDAKDAYEKICAGASLIQLVTGLIYEGPAVVGQINKGLVELMRKDGFSNISEAVGSRNRF